MDSPIWRPNVWIVDSTRDSKHSSAAFTNIWQVVNVDHEKQYGTEHTSLGDSACHTAPFKLCPIYYHSTMALRQEVIDPSQKVPRYPVSIQFPE